MANNTDLLTRSVPDWCYAEMIECRDPIVHIRPESGNGAPLVFIKAKAATAGDAGDMIYANERPSPDMLMRSRAAYRARVAGGTTQGRAKTAVATSNRFGWPTKTWQGKPTT